MRKKGGYTCLFLIKECNFCQYYSIVVKNIDFCWTFFYFFALKNSKKSKIMKKTGIYYCMFDQKNNEIQVYSIMVKKLFICVSKLPQYFVQLLAKDVRILCKILRPTTLPPTPPAKKNTFFAPKIEANILTKILKK